MQKKTTVTGANIVFLVFAVLYLLFQIVLVVLSSMYGYDFIDRNFYKISLVNEYVLVLTPVLVYAVVKRLDFRETFRINKLRPLPALLITAMFIPANFAGTFLNSLVVYLLQFVGEIPSTTIPVPSDLKELFTGLAVIAVSPAICEEMFHRGLLLKAYEKRGTLQALVITAIFFGIFHFDITNLFGTIFLGLLIGYYVIRTDSIFAGMLAHFLNNAFFEVMRYISRNEPMRDTVSISTTDLSVLAVYAFVSAILLLLFIKLFNRVTQSTAKYNISIAPVRKTFVSIITHWPVILTLVLYAFLTSFFIFSIVLTRFLGY